MTAESPSLKVTGRKSVFFIEDMLSLQSNREMWERIAVAKGLYSVHGEFDHFQKSKLRWVT